MAQGEYKPCSGCGNAPCFCVCLDRSVNEWSLSAKKRLDSQVPQEYRDAITQADYELHRAENCAFWKPQHIGRPCRHINARSPKCQKHFTDCPLHAKENDDG
jgi:hypothetical protein